MAKRKRISFDFDTKALQEYYPKTNWRNAYDDIKKHMKDNGFSWKQGSGYISDKGMSLTIVADIINSFVEKNPWVNVCMRDWDISNENEKLNINEMLDRTANVPKRSEAQKEDKKTHTMEEWQKKIAERKAEKEKSAVSKANEKTKVKTEKDRS